MATIENRIKGAKAYFSQWLWSDMITRLVTVNFIMWVIVSVGSLLSSSPHRWIGYFSVPQADDLLSWRLYTVVVYMFVHHDFLHLFCNMLWLMLFGHLFVVSQSGVRLMAVYLFGGLAGAAAFIVCNALGLAAHSGLLGASCSVLAIIGAVMMLSPSWRVNLLLIGNVKIVWVGVAAVVFFILLAPTIDECAAHAAGLCAGAVYVLLRRRGIDVAAPLLKMTDRKKPGYSTTSAQKKDDDHAMLDSLLEKVSRSGYASLTPRERQQLFDISQRIKK